MEVMVNRRRILDDSCAGGKRKNCPNRNPVKVALRTNERTIPVGNRASSARFLMLSLHSRGTRRIHGNHTQAERRPVRRKRISRAMRWPLICECAFASILSPLNFPLNFLLAILRPSPILKLPERCVCGCSLRLKNES